VTDFVHPRKAELHSPPEALEMEQRSPSVIFDQGKANDAMPDRACPLAPRSASFHGAFRLT